MYISAGELSLASWIGFYPTALAQLYGAFDSAWGAIEHSATDANREGTREAVGKAIFGLAKAGYRNPVHLANYGAYQGRLFMDLRGSGISRVSPRE